MGLRRFGEFYGCAVPMLYDLGFDDQIFKLLLPAADVLVAFVDLVGVAGDGGLFVPVVNGMCR